MMIVEIEGKQYKIKNTKYAGLVRKLRSEEYQALKDSIVRAGKLLVPILINEQGHILDGHNRYQICQETSVKARFEVWKDDKQEGELGEIICVKEANLNRRQMTEFERWEMALSLKPEYERQAKLRMSQGGKGVRNLAPLGRTDERIAAKAGCGSSNTGRKVEELLRAEKENPEKFGKLVNQLRVGGGGETGEKGRTLTIHRAWNEVKKDERMAERRAQLAREAEDRRLPDRITLLNCDVLGGDISEIPDNSVDLILTDPPYAAGSLRVYEGLADFAMRKLKEGGSVVFYAGYLLSEVMAIFARRSALQFAWQFAVVHTGHTARFHTLGIWPKWKLMLWFTKGDPKAARKSRQKDMADLIESQPPNKAIHPWAQSPVEALHVIEHLTLDENALVVDPFLGSGAFGIAAKQLGRYFVGIEIDEEKFKLADLNIKRAQGLFLTQEASAVVPAPAPTAPPSNTTTTILTNYY